MNIKLVVYSLEKKGGSVCRSPISHRSIQGYPRGGCLMVSPSFEFVVNKTHWKFISSFIFSIKVVYAFGMTLITKPTFQ